MKKLSIILMVLCCTAILYANHTPVVSVVSVSQRGDNSRFVDIYYNLSDIDGDACTVWIAVSNNGGVDWQIPANSATDDWGGGVSPGTNKHISWDAGADIPGASGSFKVRVYADDGKNGDSMVMVPAGSFPYQNAAVGNWVPLDAYMIGKYEVTVAQYCQFLNATAPDGTNYYASSMEIDRHGNAGSYTYTVKPDRGQYPVRYVSFYDAQAYAAWKSSATGLNYRLPTEQEWEKAAGWDPDLQKLWTYGYQSDNISCYRLNYNNCYGGLLPVGSFDGTDGKYNSFSYYGCYDMSGNLREWSSASYGSDRIVRGGYWNNSATSCVVTSRHSGVLSGRYSDVGFRLVLDLN